jgi:hypothetical protein
MVKYYRCDDNPAKERIAKAISKRGALPQRCETRNNPRDEKQNTRR